MSTFVLVHGAFHGAWCWDKIIPLLEKEGHNAVAFDLPGHGKDNTPLSEVTLQAYSDRTCEVLDAQPEPVILVGHSLAGMVIAQAAEYRPDKIRLLVYLTGMLPRNGESVFQLVGHDKESTFAADLFISNDGIYSNFREEAIKDTFYGDCSEEDVTWAKSLLTPRAMAPQSTPVNTTNEKSGQVRRVYIECLDDKAIYPAFQKYMYTAMPCEKVITMNTAHSPFLSAPQELVSHLTSLSAS